MRRNAIYFQSRQASEQALWAAVEQLSNGPDAINPTQIGERVGRSKDWVRLYLGKQSEILEGAVQLCMNQMHYDLDSVDSEAPVFRRIHQVVGALTHQQHWRAYAWAVILGEFEEEIGIAAKISLALGPEAGRYGIHLGFGLLGVMRSAVLEPELSRKEFADRMRWMVGAVIASSQNSAPQ